MMAAGKSCARDCITEPGGLGVGDRTGGDRDLILGDDALLYIAYVMRI